MNVNEDEFRKALNTLDSAVNAFNGLLDGSTTEHKDQEDQGQLVIESILNEFDFEKVHTIMTKLDWGWVSDEGEDDCGVIFSVPSVVQLKYRAKQLLEDVLIKGRANTESNTYYIFSGGFKATYNRYLDVDNLELEFIVESWDEDICK